MALVVGRGRRAVRLVGGHGTGAAGEQIWHSSPARKLGTAPVAPWGVPVPRRLWTNSQRLRTIKCRAHGGCWSHFFQSSSRVPARYITAAALRTPPIRAETQDWENSNFFRVLRGRATLTSNQTDFNCGRCRGALRKKQTLPLFRGPPAGSTAAGSQSAAPIGSQQQGYTHLLQGLLAARAPRRLSRKKTS